MDSASSPIRKPPQHHYIPLAISIAALFLIVVIGLYTAITYQKKLTVSGQTEVPQSNKQYSFPRLSVDSWKIESSAAYTASAKTASIYTLNGKPGRSDFESLRTHFFTPTSTGESAQSLRAYDNKAGSLFYMQKSTGSFTYKSSQGVPLASASGSIDESKKVVVFGQDLLHDDTITVFSNYEKKTTPGITYYELHRDWNRLGFPVFNLFGLSNTDPSTKLRDLSQYSSPTTPSSDNSFNTLTIGVRNGKIVDVVSNIRQFPKMMTIRKKDIIPYENAVKKLTNKQYVQLYTSPTGERVLDREKMYPQNKARLTTATVNDSIIAYTEELPGQEQPNLLPYYVFRGTGTLSTGYTVSFIASVPAVNRDVLGASTAFNNSQKQGTFLIDDQPATKSGTSVPAQSGTSAITLTCAVPQNVNQLYNVQTDDTSGITYGQFNGPEWYFVPKNNTDINQFSAILDLETQQLGEVRDFDGLLNSLESQGPICPKRLKGAY